jgi:predicted transcriptional regulator
MPSADTRVMTAHVPIPLAEQVDDLAARLDRSRGWVVKQALAAFVEREEMRRKMTLDGMADVDAGRGVSHDQVKAWAASLSSSKPAPIPKWK